MPRNFPSELIVALAQPECSPFYAVEMLFDSGAVRLWTGYDNRTIDGETYVGTGALLAIDGMEDSSDLSAKGATVTMSGLSAGVMSLALLEPYQGRRARILIGEQSVTGVGEVFTGFMDEMPIQQSAESVTVNITIESKLVTLQRANVRRLTSANHKLRHPDDTFLDWVTQLADMEVAWGRKTNGQTDNTSFSIFSFRGST